MESYHFDHREFFNTTILPKLNEVMKLCEETGIPFALCFQQCSIPMGDYSFSRANLDTVKGERLDVTISILAINALLSLFVKSMTDTGALRSLCAEPFIVSAFREREAFIAMRKILTTMQSDER